MIISVINRKGGVGKTPIAFSLAKDLDMDLQSNDKSVIADIYSRATICSPTLKDNTVYDFGGFTDTGVLDIVKESDIVFVPCWNDYNAMTVTAETISELQDYNEQIAVIITRMDKEADGDIVEETLSNVFNDLHFYRLKNSKVFKNSIEAGLSVKELYEYNPLNRSAYKSIYEQYKQILDIFQ